MASLKSGGFSDRLDDSDRSIGITELEMADLKNELVAAKARLASACSSRSWRFFVSLHGCSTAGTICRQTGEPTSVVCSPKAPPRRGQESLAQGLPW
jgi:hypothetical protein